MKKRWTENECNFLAANYRKRTPQECAEMLGRSVQSVKKKAVRLSVAKKSHIYSDHEIEYIKAHYAEKGPIQISKELDISRDLVYQTAQRLGLKMTVSGRSKISARTSTGRILSEASRQKIGDGNRKYDSPNHCVDCGKEIVRRSTRCRECGAKARGGEGHMWWKGGISNFRSVVQSRLYPAWKFPVMERDGFECVDCGSSGHLEVHHLRMYYKIRDSIIAENAHLSLDGHADRVQLAELIVADHKLEDGVTLCRPCHEQRHWEKQDELLGTLNEKDEGNQQPSASNVSNIVDVKVQRLMDEDSQPISPTRASCTLYS